MFILNNKKIKYPLFNDRNEDVPHHTIERPDDRNRNRGSNILPMIEVCCEGVSFVFLLRGKESRGEKGGSFIFQWGSLSVIL